jgi:hypothetical protein
MEASGPRTGGFLSMGVEGMWKACVYGLLREGGSLGQERRSRGGIAYLSHTDL